MWIIANHQEFVIDSVAKEVTHIRVGQVLALGTRFGAILVFGTR